MKVRGLVTTSAVALLLASVGSSVGAAPSTQSSASAAPASLTARPAIVYVTGIDGVSPIDTSTDAVGKQIGPGAGYSIAITRDGRTAYVGGNGVTPLDLRTGVAGRRIAIPADSSYGIAVTPDGSTVYTVGYPNLVRRSTPRPRPPDRRSTSGVIPTKIVITPDGKTAYVTDGHDGTVTPIDVKTNTALTPIHAGPRLGPGALAVSPDGKTVYVVCANATGGPSQLLPIDTATNTTKPAIGFVGPAPGAIAITPDGKTAFVVESGVVLPIDLATKKTESRDPRPRVPPADRGHSRREDRVRGRHGEIRFGARDADRRGHARAPGATITTRSFANGIAIAPGHAPVPNRGYYLVASDGGVFTFGSAHFYGSTGAMTLNQPIVGMAVTPDHRGYWLVAADGGVFTFGDARFYGSLGGRHLDQPITGIAAATRGGYWLLGAGGGVYTFGNARSHGSFTNDPPGAVSTAISGTGDGTGYLIVDTDGNVGTFGGAQFAGGFGPFSGSSAPRHGHDRRLRDEPARNRLLARRCRRSRLRLQQRERRFGLRQPARARFGPGYRPGGQCRRRGGLERPGLLVGVE